MPLHCSRKKVLQHECTLLHLPVRENYATCQTKELRWPVRYEIFIWNGVCGVNMPSLCCRVSLIFSSNWDWLTNVLELTAAENVAPAFFFFLPLHFGLSVTALHWEPALLRAGPLPFPLLPEQPWLCLPCWAAAKPLCPNLTLQLRAVHIFC